MEQVHQLTPVNQSAGKLIAVIEALAALNEPVKLGDLAAELDMQSSTLLRFLGALRQTGYAMQFEDTGKYALTLKFCALAEQIKDHYSMTGLLHKYLIQASALFGESAYLAIEENQQVVYIDVVKGSPQMLTTRQYIGNIAPMHCTGIGKLLLLEYSSEDIDRLISQRGLNRYTDQTLTTKEALCSHLEVIRRQGYAFDNEECEVGALCIAVPVRDYMGKIIAGISVSGPVTRMTNDLIYSKLADFLEISRKASELMGYKVVQ